MHKCQQHSEEPSKGIQSFHFKSSTPTLVAGTQQCKITYLRKVSNSYICCLLSNSIYYKINYSSHPFYALTETTFIDSLFTKHRVELKPVRHKEIPLWLTELGPHRSVLMHSPSTRFAHFQTFWYQWNFLTAKSPWTSADGILSCKFSLQIWWEPCREQWLGLTNLILHFWPKPFQENWTHFEESQIVRFYF